MTDQIPADKVREIIEKMHHHANDPYVGSHEKRNILIFAQQFAALLPPPPRPTLADMTMPERRACRWMQADVAGHSTRYVIAVPHDEDDEAGLFAADGRIEWSFPEYVTPRPDLPRMEWPGNKKPDPAPALPDGWRLADHKENGRVIVTNPTPDEDGHVYFVAPAPGPIGNDWHPCDPDELTYIDQGADQ